MSQQTAKARGAKLTHKEKKAVQAAANRKAQMQWWALGALAVIAIIAAIILISIFTEGQLPTQGHSGL